MERRRNGITKAQSNNKAESEWNGREEGSPKGLARLRQSGATQQGTGSILRWCSFCSTSKKLFKMSLGQDLSGGGEVRRGRAKSTAIDQS